MVLEEPTVEEILLNKIKQASEKTENLDFLYEFQAECTEILEKLIAESEG